MSTKAIVTQVLQAIAAGGDLAALDALVASDYLDHEARPDRPQGPDGICAIAAALRHSFSDLRFEVVDLIADGDRVAARVFLQGTHDGDFRGIPATGRVVSVQQIHIWRLADGCLAEHWACRNDLGGLRQLGVLRAGDMLRAGDIFLADASYAAVGASARFDPRPAAPALGSNNTTKGDHHG